VVLSLSLAFILITSIVLAGKPVQSQQHTTPQRDYGSFGKCPPTTHHMKLRNTDWANPTVLDKLNRIGGSMQNIENSHNYVKYDTYSIELDHMPSGLTPEGL
jgi:hypothetical protein